MTEKGEKKKKIVLGPGRHDPVAAIAIDADRDRKFARRFWEAMESNDPEKVRKIYEECLERGFTCLCGRCIDFFEKYDPQNQELIVSLYERTGNKCIELMQKNHDYGTNLHNAGVAVNNLMIYDEKKSEELRRRLEKAKKG